MKMAIGNAIERAKANVKGLKLYVPNSMSFGVVKALDLFGSTYAFSSLVCNSDKIKARSGRRVSAVARKSIRDWRVLSDDFTSVIAGSDLKVVLDSELNKKERYGKSISSLIAGRS